MYQIIALFWPKFITLCMKYFWLNQFDFDIIINDQVYIFLVRTTTNLWKSFNFWYFLVSFLPSFFVTFFIIKKNFYYCIIIDWHCTEITSFFSEILIINSLKAYLLLLYEYSTNKSCQIAKNPFLHSHKNVMFLKEIM